MVIDPWIPDDNDAKGMKIEDDADDDDDDV